MNELPNYIQNGMFGQTQPMGGYNPYQQQFGSYMTPPMNNMIPVGSYNYNQTTFQQPNNNGYVFQPVQGYNPNPYQYRQDYYNPYPQYQQQPFYSYGNYYNYSPFMSMQRQQDMLKAQVEKEKLKYRVCAAFLGAEVNEDKLDEMYNPNNAVNIKSPEQIESDREWEQTKSYFRAFQNPVQYCDSPEIRLANFLNLKIANYHKALDDHSLCQFLEEDLPKLEREFWIADNIKKNAQRDMSTTYNSTAYNELLNLHRSSNPYINELMDNARYDNNIDDTELGLAELFDRERRRRNVLEGKLPTYISSPEVQKARAEFTQQLMDQMYRKEANKNNV